MFQWFIVIPGSNSSNKLYSLQQEVETLRREKQNQQSELDSLRNRSSAVNQQQLDADRYDDGNALLSFESYCMCCVGLRRWS